MASLKGLVARLRGDDIAQVGAEIAALRELVGQVNHVVVHLEGEIARLNERVDAQHELLLEFNHDIRSGAERSLPLFVGYAERLRLDADTAIGAVQVIERQLALLDDSSGPGETPAEPAE